MKSFRFPRLATPENHPATDIRLYESETAEILNGPEPIQARITLFVLAGLFVCLLLVTVTMQIDRVVSSTAGQVVTLEPTTVMQALDQSIIKTLNVKEGDRVRKGQILATLDPTFATADVGALRSQIASFDAQIARDKAELAKRPFDAKPDPDPKLAGYVAMQRELYEQRKAQFEAQMKSYNDQIALYKATMAKYHNDETRYGDRAQISRQIEEMRANLAAAQVGSRLNLLVATDQKLEVMRNLEFGRNAAAEAQHQLDSAISTRDAYVQQWFSQTSQDLVQAQTQRDNAAEQLAKASKHQDVVQLQAPEEGIVLKMAKLSVQSVLNQGDPLIYVAPLKSPLEAEIRIPAREIGFIRAGDRTTVKLDPFNFIEHGTVNGKVRWISEGAFTTDDNNQPAEPYYKVRVAFENVDLHNVPDSFRLVPGMTLTGDIHIGKRSLFMYLMRGIARGFDESMREP